MMNAIPKVSILMPVYNVAPYLKEAMDSILNQTFKDFELIVLNDCSPDNAEEILDTYSDDRIVRYKGRQNVGLANVLNVGLQMARGEYIARMDSDDISLPERIEKQVLYLDANPSVDLVSAGMKRFGDSDEEISYKTDVEEVKFSALFYSPILHPSSIWRKDRFLAKNLFYRQEMVPAEDFDLWTRALAAGLVLVNIPDVLYLYRTHSSQVTRVNKDWSVAKIIRYNYVKSIFPDVDENKAKEFISIFGIKDADVIKRICSDFENENNKVKYFDEKKLHSKLKRFYQTWLFNQMMKDGVEWNKLFDLRITQMFKLIARKIGG